MKKTKQPTRLSLKTESVRHLTSDNLLAVAGAGYYGCGTAFSQARETCSTWADTGCQR
jgi:hypothetical protein